MRKRRKSLEDHYFESKELGDERAATIEARLLRNPNDSNNRAKLLGFYQYSNYCGVRATPHRLWFIKNRFGSNFTRYFVIVYGEYFDGTLYDETRSIVLRNIDQYPERVSMLLNAATFFNELEPEIAENLYLRAQSIKPFQSRICELLATFYQFEAEGLGESLGKQNAEKSLRQFELCWKLCNPKHLYLYNDNYNDAALMALYVGNLTKALLYAENLLSIQEFPSWINKDSEYCRALSTKGRALLRMGNIDEAKKILNYIKCDETWEGDPLLDLAQEFLDLGYRAPVYEFLETIIATTKSDSKRFKQLYNDIKNDCTRKLNYQGNFYARRADLLWKAGRHHDSTKIFNLIKDVNFRPDWKCSMARLASRMQRTAEAIRLLTCAYHENPLIVTEIVETHPNFKELSSLFTQVKKESGELLA